MPPPGLRDGTKRTWRGSTSTWPPGTPRRPRPSSAGSSPSWTPTNASRWTPIYCLLGRRRFPEAKDQWNRARPAGSGERSDRLRPAPAPAARSCSARVAEALFVQGLLTARDGQKDEALRLLRAGRRLRLSAPRFAAHGAGGRLPVRAAGARARDAGLPGGPEAGAGERGGAAAARRLALYSSGQLGAAEKELEQVLRRGPGHRRRPTTFSGRCSSSRSATTRRGRT